MILKKNRSIKDINKDQVFVTLWFCDTEGEHYSTCKHICKTIKQYLYDALINLFYNISQPAI